MDEIRRSLDFLCNSFDDTKKQNAATDKRISDLLEVIKTKDERISKLEAQVNDLEQNSKKKNLIIIGLNIHSDASTTTSTKHSTRNSTSTAAEETPTISESPTMRTNFVNFARRKLNVTPEPYHITAIHDLPPRRDGKRPIIVQFHSADRKTELIMKRGALKGTDIYLNDHLSTHSGEFFRQARQVKRDKKMHSAWTQNCCVLVEIREDGQRLKVKTLADLARV